MKEQEKKAREVIEKMLPIKELNNDKKFIHFGLENPETFIAKAFMIMAAQSIEPKLYEQQLKIYKLLCENRGLHHFKF